MINRPVLNYLNNRKSTGCPVYNGRYTQNLCGCNSVLAQTSPATSSFLRCSSLICLPRIRCNEASKSCSGTCEKGSRVYGDPRSLSNLESTRNIICVLQRALQRKGACMNFARYLTSCCNKVYVPYGMR